MMSSLGSKRNIKIFSLALAGVFIVSIGGMALMSMGDVANAAPTSDIGVVDQTEVLKNNQQLAVEYQTKLTAEADAMKKEFDEKSQGMSDDEKQKLYSDMSQQFYEKRMAIEKDMKDQMDSVVKSVASKKGLSLVVEKSAVIYGGTDITKDVTDAMTQKLAAQSQQASSASK